MKVHCTVGYIEDIETPVDSGVYVETATEKQYYGDEVKFPTYRWQNTNNLNDQFIVNNNISILADEYAYNHYPYIRYIVYKGVKWKVESIEVQRPRLLLSLGGVYNG